MKALKRALERKKANLSLLTVKLFDHALPSFITSASRAYGSTIMCYGLWVMILTPTTNNHVISILYTLNKKMLLTTPTSM